LKNANPRTHICPRVKICGLTRVEDGEAALDAGADAVGLVFYERSPRAVLPEIAAEISQAAGPFVTSVGLFVNPEVELVQTVLDRVDLQLLQFHGDESEAFCQQFGRPYMKAIRMRPELNVEQAIDEYSSATAILLDAYRKGVPGGTGETFDWQRVPTGCGSHIVLAGGLKPDNISQAVSAIDHLYGVDVSGGVESSPGVKDHQKMKLFVERAKAERVE
jgi:phosphoribosylanthranilate isomerase